MATLRTRLILRNDVTANWANVVLLKGEAGVEWYQGTGDSNGNQKQDSGETAAKPKIKIGDGFTKWSDLPYIQDGFISTTVGTSGTGNTVVGATVSYNATTGVYSITLNKANRVVDIAVSDDDIVDLAVTPNWNETDGNTNKGHTITASHKTYHSGTVPATTVTTAGNVTPAADHTINVPKVTIDKYGHTTNIENQAVTIKAHDITLTKDTSETAASADALTIVGLTKGDNHEIKYEEGYRLTRKSTTALTANTILLGNGGYDVKTSSKTITTSITDSATDTTVPTSKAVASYVTAKVASAVQYLGTVGAVTGLSTTAGKGDFYRASGDFTYTSTSPAATVKVHAGDLIVALRDNPTQTLDVLSSTADDSTAGWGVIHGEEIGVATISAADASIIVDNTNPSSPTIKANTGFTTDDVNRNYKVELAADDSGLFVNVPWLNTEYSVATASTLGLVKLGSDTKQTVAANAVTATANKTYAVQLNSSNQMVVNIPWTDTRDKGYGKITPANSTAVTALTGNTTQIVATGYSENVKFSAANKWIVLAGANSSTAGSDEMKWGHALSGVAANTYGQSADKTLVWSESAADTFTVVKPTIDAAGHITDINNITITAPNTTVTTSLRGLAPKATQNSFLVTKNSATSATWEQVLIIDGGNASTTTWGIIS